MQMILNKRFKLARNQKGMTLIELMAVVVILGILAAVAGAAVVNGFDKSRTSADATTASILNDAAQRYLMDNPPASSATTGSISTFLLRSGGYINDIPKAQTGTDSGKFYATVAWTKTGNAYTFSFTYSETAPTS